MIYFFVACFCGLGAVVRYLFSQLNGAYALPIGTLTINLMATFLMGLCYHHVSHPVLYTILSAGFLGGLGTYSTLNVEFVQLFSKFRYFISYFILTYGLGILFLWLGLQL